MTVIYSNNLSGLLSTKIASGLLKQTKKLAFWYECIHTNYTRWDGKKDYVTQLLSCLYKKHGLACSFTTAAVQKNMRRWHVFVFDCDEPTAIDLIEKCKHHTAHKVKIRMITDRLSRIERWWPVLWDGVNQQINQQQSILRLGPPLPPVPLRDLLTHEGFTKALKQAQAYYQTKGIPYYLSEVHTLLHREDMDQSLFDEAWAMYKVYKVMVA